MKKKSIQLKSLSLNKVKISKLLNSDSVKGGSGICGGVKSDPHRACRTIDYSNCPFCPTNPIDSVIVC